MKLAEQHGKHRAATPFRLGQLVRILRQNDPNCEKCRGLRFGKQTSAAHTNAQELLEPLAGAAPGASLLGRRTWCSHQAREPARHVSGIALAAGRQREYAAHAQVRVPDETVKPWHHPHKTAGG